jgi:CubicO group peptidase (beta-lactamase class C family)
MHSRHTDGSLEPIEFELPQTPEFFMGGGGLYSTGPDYLRFLRALLGNGTLDDARILQSETVDDMFRNHIGDVEAGVLRSMNPDASNDHDPYPGCPSAGASAS